jgi:hypothetical protein
MMKTDYDTIADACARIRQVSEHVIVELQSFIESVSCTGWGVEPYEGMRRYAQRVLKKNQALQWMVLDQGFGITSSWVSTADGRIVTA